MDSENNNSYNGSFSSKSKKRISEDDEKYMLAQKHYLQQQSLKRFKTQLDMKLKDEQRELQQDFQINNKDLTIVKSVKKYKALKNDLYNWGQVLFIITSTYFMFSVSFIVVSLFQFVFKGTPLLIYLSVVTRNSDFDVDPTSENGMIPLAYVLYSIQLSYALIMGTISIFGYLLKKKLEIFYANFLDKFIVGGIAAIIVLAILNYYLGDLYLYDVASYEFKNDSAKVQEEKRIPTIVMGLITILSLLAFTILGWYGRKIFLKFKTMIEAYHEFMLSFQETPRSKVAKKYLPPLDPLREESITIDSRRGTYMSQLKDSNNYASRPQTIEYNIVDNNQFHNKSINYNKPSVSDKDDVRDSQLTPIREMSETDHNDASKRDQNIKDSSFFIQNDQSITDKQYRKGQ